MTSACYTVQDQLLEIQKEQKRLQTEQQHSSRDSRICVMQWYTVFNTLVLWLHCVSWHSSCYWNCVCGDMWICWDVMSACVTMSCLYLAELAQLVMLLVVIWCLTYDPGILLISVSAEISDYSTFYCILWLCCLWPSHFIDVQQITLLWSLWYPCNALLWVYGYYHVVLFTPMWQ